MAIDNSTGKDKEFYDLGKKMFDRIQPITRGVPQIPQERYSKRPWVGLTDEEIETIADKVANENFVVVVPNFRVRFSRSIEQALKERNQ